MNIAGRMLWMHLKLPHVTVSVQPRQDSRGYIFEVKSIIDFGTGRRMAVLQSLSPASRTEKNHSWVQDVPLLPRRIDALEFVYVEKFNDSPVSIEKTLMAHFHGRRPQKITQCVLMPGDLLVFRENAGVMTPPDAYRIAQLSQRSTEEIQNAL
jgi:hypothetical protein